MSEIVHTPVRDVMTTEIEIVDGLDSVRKALEKMRDRQISSLVVDKRSDDDEYGLVTVTDIANQVIIKDKSPDRVSAYEVMTKPVLSVDAGMSIRYAIRLLGKFGVSRALVLDGRKAVGIVTLRDMVLRYKRFG